MTRLPEWPWGGVPASSHGLTLVLSTLAASLLFILSYPPWNLGVITAWVALVPLLALASHATPGRAAMCGWCCGLIANVGVFVWAIHVPGIRWHHVVLLDSYLSLYPAVWTLLVSLFLRDSVRAHWLLACSWVLLEYLRSHAGFLAFPWITLAQSQVDNFPLLQIASLLGEPAVSGLVALGNLAVWNLIRGERRLGAWCVAPLFVGVMVGATGVFGTGAEPARTMAVAALGTAFPASVAVRPDPLVRLEAQLNFLEQQTPPGLALIAMPESAIVNPQLFPAHIGRLHRFAREHHVSLVVGVAEATKFDHPPVPLSADAPRLRSEAWMLTAADTDPQRHVKSQLVPFAESRPLKTWWSWPEWLIPSQPEVVRGAPPHSYLLPDGIRVGVMICWESFFADHARALAEDGAAVLVMLANEGWFGGSAAGAQHNLTALMRAVETRRSVIVSSNMGPALVVDPYGRVVAEGGHGQGMKWAIAAAPLVTKPSLYTQIGDVFVIGCGAFLLLYVIGAGLRRSRALRSPQPARWGHEYH